MWESQKNIIFKLIDFLLQLEIDGQNILSPEQITYFHTFKTDVENIQNEDDLSAIITALAQTIQKLSDDTDILSRKISGYNRDFLEKLEQHKDCLDIDNFINTI